ncbi:MAG: hypothetical protein QM705_11850 [Ancrocorticia sp.]
MIDSLLGVLWASGVAEGSEIEVRALVDAKVRVYVTAVPYVACR